jgi:hypothetical protein
MLKLLKSDIFTVLMMALGALLVIMLPFGVANRWAVSLMAFEWIRETLNINVKFPECIEAWKLVALSWSLIYLIAYMFFKFPRTYPSSTRMGMGFGGITILISFWVKHLYAQEDNFGISKLWAELVVIGWLVVIDIIIAYWVDDVGETVRRDYKNFLWIVDFPGLVGLATLLGFLLCLRASNIKSEHTLSFLAGASAMNLLVVNTAFAVLFLREGGSKKI